MWCFLSAQSEVMTMQVDLGMVLLIARCLMLLLITIILGSYYDPKARHRWLVSLFAFCIAGISLGWSVFSMLMVLQGQAKPEPLAEIWPTIFVFCATIPVLYTRGNVAKLLPRVQWLHR
jgi:hypothetical protein